MKKLSVYFSCMLSLFVIFSMQAIRIERLDGENVENVEENMEIPHDNPLDNMRHIAAFKGELDAISQRRPTFEQLAMQSFFNVLVMPVVSGALTLIGNSFQSQQDRVLELQMKIGAFKKIVHTTLLQIPPDSFEHNLYKQQLNDLQKKETELNKVFAKLLYDDIMREGLLTRGYKNVQKLTSFIGKSFSDCLNSKCIQAAYLLLKKEAANSQILLKKIARPIL